MQRDAIHSLNIGRDEVTYTQAKGRHGAADRTEEEGPYTSTVVGVEDASDIEVRDDGWWGDDPLYSVSSEHITSVKRRRH